MSVILDLATAKAWLRVGGAKEDTIIQLLLDAAEDWVAEKCQVVFKSVGAGDFTENLDGGNKSLEPTNLPITAVGTILDRDDDDAEFEEDVEFTKWRIFRTSGDDLDSLVLSYRDRQSEFWGHGRQRWQVTYTAGYDSDTCPAGLKQIILDYLFRIYDNRGGKERQAAAGHGRSWQPLSESDILEKMVPYQMGLGI